MLHPMSFRQRTLLRMILAGNAPFNSNISVWRAASKVPVERLRLLHKELVATHQALRLNIENEEFQLESTNAESTMQLDEIDIETEEDLVQASSRLTLAPFITADQIGERALSRLVLLNAGDQRYLGLIMSHLVADATSLHIVGGHIDQALGQSIKSCPHGREPSALFTDFVRKENDWLTSYEARQQASFWFEYLSNLPNYKFEHQKDGLSDTTSLTIQLTAERFEDLNHVLRMKRHTLFTALCAGYAAAIASISNRRDIVFRSMSSNRTDQIFKSTVGYFATPFAIRLRLQESETIENLLQKTFVASASAFRNVRTFQVWNEMPGLGTTTFFKIIFRGSRHRLYANLINGQEVKRPRVISIDEEPSAASGVLALVYELEDRLVVRIAFNPSDIPRSKVNDLARHLAYFLNMLGEGRTDERLWSLQVGR